MIDESFKEEKFGTTIGKHFIQQLNVVSIKDYFIQYFNDIISLINYELTNRSSIKIEHILLIEY